MWSSFYEEKHMKILILVILLSSISAWGAFPLINFENLSGDYANGKGIAYAESGKYTIPPVKISHKEIEVDFNKQQKHLIIKDDNTAVELGFDFSFLNVFRALNFSGVDIKSNQKKFAVFLETLNIYIDPNEYRVREIDVVADISKITDIGDDIDVLDGFIVNGDLNITELSFGTIDKEAMVNDLVAENPKHKDKIVQMFSKLKAIPVVARNLRMVVRKKTFSGSVKLDSWINLNAYLGGKIDYDKKNNKITINLLKAKLGYFSIRKWALNSIKKLKLENITVSGTNIIIDLEKTILTSRD